jgi:alkylhydroperoxidase family enzyme
MPWIRLTDDVPSELGLDKRGNVIKVLSINPTAVQAVLDMNMGITFGASALSRVEEEAIATAVSVVNRCQY